MKNIIKNNIPEILIGLYPFSLLLGTLISESINIILILFFAFNIFIKKNDTKIFLDKIIYILFFIWLYLLINLLNSTDIGLSFSRCVYFIRFPILILAISYFLNNSKELKIIFSLWVITLIIIIFDLYFQNLFGFNTVGYVSPMPGRLPGFLKDELKIAHLLIGFFIPSLAYLISNKISLISNKKNLFFLIIILIIYLLIILLINERANAIRAIFIITFFLMMNNFIKTSYIFLSMLIFIVTISLTISFNSNIKQRFFTEITNMNTHAKNLPQYILLSNYGPHYLSGYEVFKKYPIFGSGLKTFRVECKNINIKKYYTQRNLDTITNIYHNKCTTHPHQTYIELLSETGFVGFFSFFSFFIYFLFRGFKVYLKNQNPILLGCCLFIISEFIPLLPSGSFFTSFSATIFWINVSVAYSLIKKYE